MEVAFNHLQGPSPCKRSLFIQTLMCNERSQNPEFGIPATPTSCEALQPAMEKQSHKVHTTPVSPHSHMQETAPPLPPALPGAINRQTEY